MPDVEPWDIALNNRQREDVGVFMTYKRFDEMLERVRLDEHERIIALLEDAGEWGAYNLIIGDALIRGEKNG